MSLHPFKDRADAIHNMILDSYGLIDDNKHGLCVVGDKNGICVDFHINKYHNILPKIKKVIFNPPATIIFWDDNSKTVVKCQNNEIFDPEKALAMAISKRALGNEGNYYNIFKKYTTDVVFQNSFILAKNNELCKNNKYIRQDKYGDFYDIRYYFAGTGHKIVCAGDCYHVRNIKKENRITYSSLKEALDDGCTPCKHCHGMHKIQ